MFVLRIYFLKVVMLAFGAVFLVAPLQIFADEAGTGARDPGLGGLPSSDAAQGGNVEPVIAAPAIATSSSAIPSAAPASPRSASPKPASAQGTEPVQETAPKAKEGGGSNTAILAALASLGVLAVGYGASRLIRKNTQNNKEGKKEENSKCDSIKSLLDQKKQELEEMARNWPEEKIKSIVRGKAIGKLKENEDAKKLITAAEEAKEKYDKLKEAVELLQNKYELCKKNLSLKTGKRVLIVHGWDGSPDSNWFPWLKNELEAKGFKVVAPQLPAPENPRIEKWVPKLAESVGVVDGNTYFIGHSMGCQTIARYLETLPKDTKVGGAIFVAGFFKRLTGLEDDEDIRETDRHWLLAPLDLAKVRNHLAKSVAIFSDDDPYVPLDNQNDFRDKLGSEIFIEHKKGHFDEREAPEILEKVLGLLRQ